MELQAAPPCRLFVGSAIKPEVKASDVFLFGLHPKFKPETFLVGFDTCFCAVFHPTSVFTQKMRPRALSSRLRDLQTGSESIRRAVSSSKMPRDRLCRLFCAVFSQTDQETLYVGFD